MTRSQRPWVVARGVRGRASIAARATRRRTFGACGILVLVGCGAPQRWGAPASGPPTPTPTPTPAIGDERVIDERVVSGTGSDAYCAAFEPVRVARADVTDAPPDEAPRRWYGWQVLLLDHAAIVTMILGASANDDKIIGVGLSAAGGVAYLAGAPIVHAVQGHKESVGNSVAMRLFGAAIATPALIAARINHSHGDGLTGVGVALFIIPAHALAIVDASALSSVPSAAAKETVSLLPTFHLSQTGAELGAAGQF